MKKKATEHKETRCCDFCGRDTKNVSKICRSCCRGSRDHTKYIPSFTEDDDLEGMRQLFGFTDVGREDMVDREVSDAMRESIE